VFSTIISFPVQQCKTGAGCDLAGNSDLVVCLVANRAGLLIIVVEDDRDRRLLDTSLALLVDELLQRTGTDLPQRNNREKAGSNMPDPIQLGCAPEIVSGASIEGHRVAAKRGSDLLQARDAEDKADRVQNVGLSRAVQARDGVEGGVESLNHCALCVRLHSGSKEGRFVASDPLKICQHKGASEGGRGNQGSKP
jgi:hypothetical protein